MHMHSVEIFKRSTNFTRTHVPNKKSQQPKKKIVDCVCACVCSRIGAVFYVILLLHKYVFCWNGVSASISFHNRIKRRENIFGERIACVLLLWLLLLLFGSISLNLIQIYIQSVDGYFARTYRSVQQFNLANVHYVQLCFRCVFSFFFLLFLRFWFKLLCCTQFECFKFMRIHCT